MRLSATNNNQFNPGVVESKSPISHPANNWWNLTVSLHSPPPHPLPLSHHYQFAGMKILFSPRRREKMNWPGITLWSLPRPWLTATSVTFFSSSSIFTSLREEGCMLGNKKGKRPYTLHTCMGFADAKQTVNMWRVSMEEHMYTKTCTAHLRCWDLNKEIPDRPDVCLGVTHRSVRRTVHCESSQGIPELRWYQMVASIPIRCPIGCSLDSWL